jgi:hypothetical protein
MCNQHWLGVLEMSSTRHGMIAHLLGALDQNPHALEQYVPERSSRISRKHPHKRGNLVIATAPGSKRSAQSVTDPLPQDSLERAVNVLVGLLRLDTIPQIVFAHGVHSGKDAR